jgi:hypothetical protein
MVNHAGAVQVMAGNGSIGTNDSPYATSAEFNLPGGLFWDTNNNLLLISDTRNDTLRSLFLTNYQGSTGYAVQTVAGVPGARGFVDGALGISEFFHPYGLCLDANAFGYYVVDSGNNALRVLQPTEPPPPPVPVPDPAIGYVTFPLVNGAQYATFNAITAQISIFNNLVDLAIEQLDPTVQTYMSYGPTGSVIAQPGTNASHVSPFTLTDVGATSFQGLNITPIPDMTLATISEATGRPSSDAISAEIKFVTSNPNIIGNNAAAVTLLDATTNALMWYTLNGSNPVPGTSYTLPASATQGIASGQLIAFTLTNSPTTLSVQAFCSNSTAVFAPSSVVTAQFTTNNYITDDITFGFASGEASSEFITAPGQTFIAPVTMSLIPSANTMDSLQFSLAIANVTNNGSAPPAIPTNSLSFFSMLDKPTNLPAGYTVYIPITNAMFADIGFTNLQFTNFGAYPGPYFTNLGPVDLLGIGWVELPPNTNLYPAGQCLISFSVAHDTLYLNTGGQVIVGAFSFYVPTTATVGQLYAIQIGSPSATLGVQPVLLNVVTNGSLTNGPVNSTKLVTVGTNQYLVGDVYPFGWFNAGDFGQNFLYNVDVVETFQTAVYGLNGPYLVGANGANSDYFDAMDSSNGSDNNYYLGTDTAINSILFGDHRIQVDDVYVTYRRSLDPALLWVYRQHSTGGLVAYTTNSGLTPPFSNSIVSAARPADQPASSSPRYVTVGADQVNTSGSLSAQVPIRVLAADLSSNSLPITVMMLRVEVDALDGSPPVTEPVSFSANPNLGEQFGALSQGPGDFSGVWLNSGGTGVAGTNVLGTLTVSLPANVTANSAYLVHFDHFSASPNGIALFHSTAQDGLITVGDRSRSSWGDGIPDSWRLLWFGSVSNALSAANADPDGDGANNWQEYVAGTNPLDAASVFQCQPGGAFSPPNFTLQWPSVVNKNYSVQCAASLAGSWTTLASNILGNGQTMQWTDSNANGQTRFYRALVQ